MADLCNKAGLDKEFMSYFSVRKEQLEQEPSLSLENFGRIAHNPLHSDIWR